MHNPGFQVRKGHGVEGRGISKASDTFLPTTGVSLQGTHELVRLYS